MYGSDLLWLVLWTSHYYSCFGWATLVHAAARPGKLLIGALSWPDSRTRHRHSGGMTLVGLWISVKDWLLVRITVVCCETGVSEKVFNVEFWLKIDFGGITLFLPTALRDVLHTKVYTIHGKPLPCELSALGEAVLYLWMPKYIGPRGSRSDRIGSVVSLLVLAHLKVWIDSARSSEMGKNTIALLQ